MERLKSSLLVLLAASTVSIGALLIIKTFSSRAASSELGLTETAAYLDPAALGTYTATEELPTDTPTASPTFTIISPAETQTPPAAAQYQSSYQQAASSECDMAGFVDDITIPDGTEMSPGTSFTKTWSLSNDGTCTWDTDYRIYFYSGSSMDGPSSQQLVEDEVEPGETVEVSVELVAPDDDGSYIGYWALENADGTHFGIGLYGEPFYVEIVVSSDLVTATSTPTLTATSTITEETSSPTETPAPTATPVPTTEIPADTATQAAPSETPLPTEIDT